MLNTIRARQWSSLVVILAAAVVLSFSATLYFWREGTILSYTDGESHLLIARRVISFISLAQLGRVWLPLPHLAILPLVGNDFLYSTGLAGSFFSMACYIGTAFFVYQTALVLTQNKRAGTLSAAVFMTNPNVLYMQSTPMTELPLFLFLAATVYFLLLWSRNTLEFPLLLGAGMSIGLATLVRYEAWFMLPVVAILVCCLMVRDKLHYPEIEDFSIANGTLAFVPVIGWLLWNFFLFGDPIGFQRGEYAKPSLWVAAGEINVGNWSNSFLTYLYAMIHTLGWPVLIAAGCGFLYLLDQRKLRSYAWILSSFCAIFVFFVIVLYLGQRPLHVQEIQGDLYNTRFGLIMILPACLLAGYLASLGRIRFYLAVLAAGTAGLMMFHEGIITRVEPVLASELPDRTLQNQAAEWFNSHYDNGPILLESYGNEQFLFDTGNKLDRFITEGSYQKWDSALSMPGNYVQWVVTRGQGLDKDKLWDRLITTGTISNDFRLVYQNDRMLIYHKINQLRGGPV